MFESMQNIINRYIFNGAGYTYEWGTFFIQVGGAIATCFMVILPFVIVYKIISRWL